MTCFITQRQASTSLSSGYGDFSNFIELQVLVGVPSTIQVPFYTYASLWTAIEDKSYMSFRSRV